MVALLAARPLPPPSVLHPGLSWLQAFRRLWWQHWDPPARDLRGLRWFAALCSLLLHLLFAFFLIWVALVRTASPPDDGSDGQRVEVAYIGRGTPEQEGGGEPASAAAGHGAAAASRTAPAISGASAAATAAAADAPSAQAVQRETIASAPAPALPPSPSTPSTQSTQSTQSAPSTQPTQPTQPTPPAVQPLQVTEVAEPVSDFVLPPSTALPSRIEARPLRSPELQVQVRSIENVQERPAALQLRTPITAQPSLSVPQVQVREREIQIATAPTVVTARLPDREVQAQLRTPDIAIREVRIAAAAEAPAAVPAEPIAVPAELIAVPAELIVGPTTTTAAAAATATATTTSTATGAAATGQASSPAAVVSSPAAKATGNSAGAGPRPEDRAGGWQAPARSDDWGAAKSASAGRQANSGNGLFNADGSVRVPGSGDKAAAAPRGVPGGDADSWTRDRIADSGTWLKRPPYDYTPTSFEKYWVPSESLLAEWVRKGIKSIEIPIPGTNTRISCVVSMLQFGGGCGLSNPNMQEQPATARPPPDIPFKQELQEDNGSR